MNGRGGYVEGASQLVDPTVCKAGTASLRSLIWATPLIWATALVWATARSLLAYIPTPHFPDSIHADRL